MSDVSGVRTKPTDLLSGLEGLCRETISGDGLPRVVSDIMTGDVHFLTLNHSVKACLEFMESHHVRHAPVVDYPNGKEAGPEFIGVISQRDVLRIGERVKGASPPTKPDPRALKRLLTHVVTRKPKVVERSTPIDVAAATMINRHIDMLPVLDQGRVIGIVTTIDLARMLIGIIETIEQTHRRQTGQKECSAWLRGMGAERLQLARYARRTIGQIMVSDVVTLAADQTLADAIDIMQAKGLRHLPVIGEHGKLAGILSDRDILASLPYMPARPVRRGDKFREALFADDGSVVAAKIRVVNAMTPKVATVTPNDLVVKVARVLKRKGFGALPVVDSAGDLVGIVTMVDLLQMIRDLYTPARGLASRSGPNPVP